MLDTKRSRGRLIGILSAALIAGYLGGEAYWSAAVAKKAKAARHRLEYELPRLDPISLATGDQTALDELGPYRRIARTPDDGLIVSVEVSAGWRTQCVIATRSNVATVAVRTVNGRCR